MIRRSLLPLVGWVAINIGALNSTAQPQESRNEAAPDRVHASPVIYPDSEPPRGSGTRSERVAAPSVATGNGLLKAPAAGSPTGVLNPARLSAAATTGTRLGDLNGDGADDVLLRHANGRWHYYPMDGSRFLPERGSANLTPKLDWRLVGIGDLDGNGTDDVLLRHVDGPWHYYPMNGRRYVSGRGPATLTRNLEWQFAGTGDLDGNGTDDVLLRHTDGRWYYYPMHGRRPQAGRGIAPLTKNLDWRFAGIGDLNGDGNDDVLLRHADGRWYYYPMDGRQPRSGRGIAALTRNLDWRFAGIGDLNGDGNDDVLLRHADGRWYYYPMDGRQPLADRGPVSLTRDLSWQFAGIGDLNGDSTDDVLLRHVDGRWYHYPMDGRRSLATRGVANLTRNLDWYLPTVFRSVPGFRGPNQTYLQTRSLPFDLIEREWDRDRYITSLVRDDGYWSVVMSRSTGSVDAQSIHVSASFPEDAINAAWADGQRITEVAYGNGVWVVVMSSSTDYGRQLWALRGQFPEDEIREARSDGHRVTNLTYGDGRWLLVASDVSHYAEQDHVLGDVNDFISTRWEQDYVITETAFGDGDWAVVMTRTGHRWGQSIRSHRAAGLPSHEIRSLWDRGLDVLDITWGAGYFTLSASRGLSNVKGFSPPVLPSGGTLRTQVTSYSGRSADIVIDLFAVDSNSDLLDLDADDFSISSFEGNAGGTYAFSQTQVVRVNQSYVGPYSAAFLFDQSGSITGTDPGDSRVDAAKVFMRNLDSGDEVGLLAFASGGSLPYSPVTSYSDANGNAFTNDPRGFDGTLQRLRDQEGGGTPLYDAVRTAVRYTVDNAANANRVVIVFTDGEDTSSTHSLDDAVAMANQHNVPLHTIALASGVDMGVLSTMAGRTGGALARASDAKRLISYYGALGPFLSGSAAFYRTVWRMSLTGGTNQLGRGSWIRSCVYVSAPGGTLCVPFRADFN